MRRIQHIFLDDGGVVNDNALRGLQWQRLVGEYFAPRLGGAPEAWAEANGRIFRQAYRRWDDRIAAWSPAMHPLAFEYDLYLLDWLRSMCAALEAECPAADDDVITLARAGHDWITSRVHAAFPGAVEAVRALSHAGFGLFSASSSYRFELQPIFEALGIEDCFVRLYGIDIVNTPKTSSRYYERIFAHAGVDPSTALVVDDKMSVLTWAKEAGAMTALVGEGTPGVHADIVVPLLRDLPAVLEAMDS